MANGTFDSLNVNPGGIVIGNPDQGAGGFTSLTLTISKASGGYSGLQSIKASGTEYGDIILNEIAGNVGIGTSAIPAHSRLAVVGGAITVGSSPYTADAAIHISSSFGECDRLLQMGPTGPSKPGLNLLASNDAAGNAQWWSWGVTIDNKWRIQPGWGGFGGSGGLTIDPTGTVGTGSLQVNGKLGVGVGPEPQSTAAGLFHVWGGISTGGHSPASSIDGWITFFASDPNSPWIHIQSTGGRLHVSHGGNPGDNEIMSIGADGWLLFPRTKPGVGYSIAMSRDTGEINFTNPDNNYTIKINGRDNKLSVGGVVIDGIAGDVTLPNQDCAEDFEVVAAVGVEPGTVMVIDETGALQQSWQAYDKKVAGVISGAGSCKPGIVLNKQPSQDSRMPIALVGKVYCKVDAQYSPVEVGDLLTTSPTPGYAMKAADPFKAFGAVIGKALRPLSKSQGLIPILIALQ